MPVMMLDTECVELAHDDFSRAMLFESQFGMGVQVAPNGRQLGQILAQTSIGFIVSICLIGAACSMRVPWVT